MNTKKVNTRTFPLLVLMLTVIMFFSFRIFTSDYNAKSEKISTTIIDKDSISDNITVLEAYDMIIENLDNPDFVILDVRTPKEYDAGYIENCVLIDFKSYTFKEEIDALDKSYTYLVYCRSGGRSASTLNIMKELGFENVYNMLGGIKAWKKESLPLIE